MLKICRSSSFSTPFTIWGQPPLSYTAARPYDCPQSLLRSSSQSFSFYINYITSLTSSASPLLIL